MKKPSWLVVLVCLGAWALLSGESSCTSSAPPNPSNLVELTILHTNDIHSHLKAEPSPSEKNPFNLGGLARLKTLIDQIRGTRPNTLLLDAGDWSEGISYFQIDGGSNMLRMLDTIGYDAVVVGNHDFLNGPSELASTIERASPRFPVLAANIDLSDASLGADRARIQKNLLPYKIFSLNGVRVAVIGLITFQIDYFEYFKPGTITEPAAKAIEIASSLLKNDQADVLVVLSHNNLPDNVRYARQVPGVSVVVSGHTHAKTPQPILTTNGGDPAYVVEAKQWGQFLGDLTLVYDKTTRKVALKNYVLHPVTADLAEDPKVASLIAQQDAALIAKFGRDILHDRAVACPDELLQADEKESVLGNAAAEAYRVSAAANVGFEVNSLIGVGAPAGNLSTVQVMDLLPHIYHPDGVRPFPQFGKTWTIKTLEVSGLELRALLNFALDTTGFVLGWLSTSGLKVSYSRLHQGILPVSSVEVWDPVAGNYAPLREDARYTVALHDGLLLSLKLLSAKGLILDLSGLKETGIEVAPALISLLGSKGRILMAEDFASGRAMRSLEPDLALEETAVALEQDTGSPVVLQAKVKNSGLSASKPGSVLQVYRSAPNDVQHDYTDLAETTRIGGDIPIPPLEPGAQTQISIPWAGKPEPGVYSFKLQITPGTDPDGNLTNNTVVVHRVIH